MKMYPSNNIELKSVYLTIVTWDLTERWTEIYPSIRLN